MVFTDFSSFNYFETLFTNAKQNAVLLMNGDGTIVAVNESFTRHFGYTQKDIVGKNLAVLFTREDREQGLPEKEIRLVKEKGQSSDNNYLVHKRKTITWVSGESLLLKNEKLEVGILKVIQSIHEQKLLENNLRVSHDFNEDILKSIDDVVIVLDAKMNVIKTNHAFAGLFGEKIDKTVKLNFADFIRPYDVNNNLLNSIQHAITNKDIFSNKQIEIDTASGDKRIFDVSCTPMIDNAVGNNVLLVVHDITVHKQVEREREDIISFIAHELRNPLANLVLCNEIMGESIQSGRVDEAKDMLQRSKNNVMRLNKMIAELYDATKVNSGNLQLEITEFNFTDMVEEAIDTVGVLQPAYNIILKGDGNIQIRGDRYRLIQVITNYLGNGIKYSNGKTDVILGIGHDDKFLTVSVKDEGLGISKDQLPYIFDKFFRAEKTRNIEGIGLGLYLCRQIIHAHKGKVWAESEEGKGSTFYFSIPINL